MWQKQTYLVLIIYAFTVTLTLKLAKQFFHTALGRAHDFPLPYQDRLQKVQYSRRHCPDEYLGVGIADWLERRTRDWKVAGSNPCRSGGRISFSRVDYLYWLLFRYPFHPRVTAVARKPPR